MYRSYFFVALTSDYIISINSNRYYHNDIKINMHHQFYLGFLALSHSLRATKIMQVDTSLLVLSIQYFMVLPSHLSLRVMGITWVKWFYITSGCIYFFWNSNVCKSDFVQHFVLLEVVFFGGFFRLFKELVIWYICISNLDLCTLKCVVSKLV